MPESHGWMQTFIGKKVFPLALNVSDVDIRDIAHSLSLQTRYAGHCKRFYSVAEHCLVVSQILLHGESAITQLYGLLHDASEAYLTDLPRGLKYLDEFEFYRKAEKRAEATIYMHFGLSPDVPKVVKKCDTEMLYREFATPCLMYPPHPDVYHKGGEPLGMGEPYPPELAEVRYLQCFNSLIKKLYKANDTANASGDISGKTASVQ